MLYLVEPIPIGNTHLVYSNIVEDDRPEWAATASYARDARVMMRLTHKVYRAVANVGPAYAPGPYQPPSNDLFHPETNVDGKWQVVGATRRWKPFDGSISDQVQGDYRGFIQWNLAPGPGPVCDSVALFGLQATRVRVRVAVRATQEIIYERSESTIDLANITDGWDYFTNPPAHHTEIVFRGLPLNEENEIHISISHTGDYPRVGEIVMGREVEVGTLLVGGGISLNDYSLKERDDFGNPVIKRRAYSDVATYPVLVTAGRERYILRTLGRLRATPAVFHAGEDMTSRGLTVYGFFRDVPVTLSGRTHSQFNIEVEGLT